MQRTFCALAILASAALMPAIARGGDQEDRATAEQIATVLRDSGRMQHYSVGVKYKNGTVWLSGKVQSTQQMQSALQVVSDIEGIEQIVNNMKVSPSKASGVRQTSAQQGAAMRRTPTIVGGPAEMQQEGGEAVPAGFHQLAAGHAARHAAPPVGYMPGGPASGPPPAYDQPHMPNYSWPSYASYPNYAALTYPKQYSATAFPYIGPFYPYPQVPLGWRKVALEWDDGWWFLDFYDRNHH